MSVSGIIVNADVSRDQQDPAARVGVELSDRRWKMGMTGQEKTKLIACLQSQREAMCGELPIYDSLIGYNLFLVLCQCELRDEAPRLKDIYLELGRSQGAVRRLITSLSADGWITIAKSNGDQRSRYAVATSKLKQVIAKFTQSIHATC